MAFQQAIIMAPIIASILIPMASATAGTSTFYTTYVPSACYGFNDQGTLIAAVPRNLYDGGQACGRSYRIRCTAGGTKSEQNPCRGGDVVVKVVDLCPRCADNQIDLSQQAFSMIGYADAGTIRINFTLLTTHADAPSSPRSGYGLPPAPSNGYHPQDPVGDFNPKIIRDMGENRTKVIIGVLLGVAGMIILSISICCILKRLGSVTSPNPESKHDVERILLQWGSLTPKRFKYSEIKKMTKSMADKLGEGGYGSVYKGMRPDGVPVAVKVLTDMKSNGEDFINEVVSISRTSHVNIVTLLGFCYEGNRRALVYEFMRNSSLDKFLNRNESAVRLDLEKLYNIAVGIAKGLEYLHTGCTTRIVHFDIKPQNILLDEDLCPKISDFGLAKLCKKKQSVLSVVGMRGTIGYIAPEVFSRNFGGVSHKSDVYSYGMMILEMAGVGKAEEIRSSENYFPDRIYEQVISEVGNDLNMMEEEEERRTKMILVGFWCIQTNPMSRPSISHVLEMLEGSLESIQIPPKPFLFTPPNIPTHEDEVSSSFVETMENSVVDERVTSELPS